MQSPNPLPVFALCILGLLATLGCAGFQAVNEPIAQITPDQGYRQFLKPAPDAGGKVWLTLAFSGGGTRAAAFAYGVLEELRDTPIHLNGKPSRLLDEVDTISAVSGGTFPAAYYGLFGDRIFEDFEGKFLDRNIQRALVFEALRPKNMVRLLSPSFSRSLLAMEYYDRNVFEGATFADLRDAPGPHVHINATDLSHGFRFTFNQGQFDVICSDLDSLPVSTAVAASSAVPVLLSPITLKNYAGTCGFQSPAWIEQATKNRSENRRRYEAARSFLDFADADSRPYIHLIDGGIADNLGLRYSIELAEAAGGVGQFLKIVGREPPDYFIVIVVNAETAPNPGIDLSSASPSFASLMTSVSGAQIRRYNLETLMLTDVSLKEWAEILSQEFDKPIYARLIEINFDSIQQEQNRDYFKLLPTSFVLSSKTVDDLRSVGRSLLRNNIGFQEFLQNFPPPPRAAPSSSPTPSTPPGPGG